MRTAIFGEVCAFFLALQFFTRIPIPSWVHYSERGFELSRTYFPAIGLIVGLLTSLVWVLAMSLFGIWVGTGVMMGCSLLITGAFHEDGFADVCDGIGGGYTIEDKLRIMKDSRLGTYGVVGIVMMLALKGGALSSGVYVAAGEIPPLGEGREWIAYWLCVPVLLIAHVQSRFTASELVELLPYVRLEGESKVKPIATQRLGISRRVFGFMVVLLACSGAMVMSGVLDSRYTTCFVLFSGTSVVFSYIIGRGLAVFFRDQLGGYTGDCLGAAQQLVELVHYLLFLFLLRSFPYFSTDVLLHR